MIAITRSTFLRYLNAEDIKHPELIGLDAINPRKEGFQKIQTQQTWAKSSLNPEEGT